LKRKIKADNIEQATNINVYFFKKSSSIQVTITGNCCSCCKTC